MSEIYRVYAYDLNKNELICEIPATDLAFDSRLNDAGSIGFSIPISRPEVVARVRPLITTYHGKPFAVYVSRQSGSENLIVWAGIIWTWNYSRSSGVVSLQGKEMTSWYSQRTIAKDYSYLAYDFTQLVKTNTAGSQYLSVLKASDFAVGENIIVGDTDPENHVIAALPTKTTTISSTVNAGDTTVHLTSTSGLDVGMRIKLSGTKSSYNEIVTIASVHTGYITIHSGESIKHQHATGKTVVLVPTIKLTDTLLHEHSDKESVFEAIDPAFLLTKVLEDAQSSTWGGPGGDIGIEIVGTTSTLPKIAPSYPLTQRTIIHNVITDMSSIQAAGAGSIDSILTSEWVSKDDGSGDVIPHNKLTIYSPRAGQIGDATNLLFDMNKCLDYTFPLDATQIGTTDYVHGTTIEYTIHSSQPVGDLGQLPRLDKVVSFNNIASTSQLKLMAQGVVQQFAEAVSTPTIVQPTAAEPQLGHFHVGDDARLFLTKDEFFPDGYYEIWRIVQWQVKVPNEGVPEVTITFNPPPII
jgi:hypothetical protein